jgi:hypothetical protein
MGADETQIEASPQEAIRTAKQQKSAFASETRRSNLRGTVAKKRAGHEDVDSDYLSGKASVPTFALDEVSENRVDEIVPDSSQTREPTQVHDLET